MAIFQIHRNQNSGERCWCWRLLAENGTIIAESNNLFIKADIVNPIKQIIGESQNYPILEQAESKESVSRCEYHQKEGKWYLKTEKNEIIATGEIDVSADAKNALKNILKEIKDAKITWENEEDDPAYQAKNDDSTTTKGAPGSIFEAFYRGNINS